MKAAELRQSILQAAVQGKLVPQDLHDEPASVLLERIRAEKDRLVKEGKIKKENPLQPIIEDEVPYDLPEGWIWCYIGDFCSVLGGKRIPKGFTFSNFKTDHIYIRVTDMKNGTISNQNLKYIENDVYEKIKQYTISSDDVYVTIAGTIGKCGIVPEQFNNMNLTENAAKLCNIIEISKKYIVYAISSSTIQEQFIDLTNQMAQPKLALTRIKSTYFPLPPLAEQQRIVAKIDELMILCDELEAAEQELDALESRFEEYLPKSILQAAVQGKLVPQDLHDEPASVLLKRISTEKVHLVKEGKIKKEKPLPPISEDEIPYYLPEGWVWCRLGDCIFLISGRDLNINMINESKQGIPYITGASEINGNIIMILRWTVEPTVISIFGDLLLSCKGTVGKLVFNNIGECHIARQIMALRFFSSFLMPEYVKIVLHSYIGKLVQQAKSMIPGISRDDILNICFPLPPLAEQQRIIAKVNKLMTLYEELKAVKDKPIEHKVISNIIDLPMVNQEEQILLAARGKMNEKPSAELMQTIDDMFAEDD